MNPSASQTNRSLQLTLEDNGKQVVLKSGDTLVIQLRTNPTTGFDWQAGIFDPQILLEEKRIYTVLSDAMGSPSDLAIHYRAVASGKTHLELHYRRSWEKEPAPLQTFQVDIECRGN